MLIWVRGFEHLELSEVIKSLIGFSKSIFWSIRVEFLSPIKLTQRTENSLFSKKSNREASILTHVHWILFSESFMRIFKEPKH